MQGAEGEGDGLFRLCSQCVGHPVRISLFHPTNGGCIGRYPGLIAKVFSDGIQVECLEAVPGTQTGTPVAMELMRNGQFFWANTRVNRYSTNQPHVIWLQLPQQIQAVQKRAHPRTDVNVPVHYVADKSRDVAQGLIINISAGGAALRGAVPIAVGQKVSLVFALGSGFGFQDIGAEVVRLVEESEGWVHGLRFLDLDQDHQRSLATWVDRQVRDKERKWADAIPGFHR